jgi:hypothetical protein
VRIVIKGRVAKALIHDLKKIDKETFQDEDGWRDVEVDLTRLTQSEQERLYEVLAHGKVPGAKVVAADIKKYLKAGREGINSVTARTVRQAAWMLEHYFASLEHHLIFSEDDYEGGSFVGYFVEDVDYVEKRDRDPEHVSIRLVWIENDARDSLNLDWYAGSVLGRSPIEILKDNGYTPESSKLMATLKTETELYYELREKVGKKYVGAGIGVADLDDASETQRHWRARNQIRLDNFDLKTPVVIDVLHETDSKNSNRDSDTHVNLYRWHKWNLRFYSPSEDELVKHLEADENSDFAPELQLPVHPLVPCFDLKRHQRLRVHVNNLTPYKYRREVAEGLVIPERDRRLVNLLVDQSNNTFQDVVEGKGQSMNVLSGGPPGTGKTLTVEVFAEFKERPLYNVQCSQLGLSPDDIEKNLSVILQRANRWNAVLLLDEADVYIRTRGDDLMHNAIVGVFLRVLEYASCILFMTTNLPEAVDDAIASRCVVALHYRLPNADQQAEIWRNLAKLNKLTVADKDIKAFITKHPRVSGRDVKNLLKLASFIAQSEDRLIDIQALEFALEYKPTADVPDEVVTDPLTVERRRLLGA